MTVSRVFPKTHARAGEPTYFREKILNSINLLFGPKHIITNINPKLHTIRANYPLWKKRIDEVNAGEAILSVRYWSGKPYNSKQLRIVEFDKDSGVGVQELKLTDHGNFIYGRVNGPNEKPHIHSDCVDFENMRHDLNLISKLAQNEGLSYEDLKEWFRKYDLSKPMAIIHFTKFRY